LPLIRSRKGKGKGKGDNARFPPPKPENLLKSACLMPRQARVVAAGVPHHITHRGNNRQDVFLSDEDRRRYQNLLRDQLEPCAIELLGWCWMTNHVHLVAIPKRPDSLAKLILRVHSRYAQAFNRRYIRTGHLWHSRFFSCTLGARHLQIALLYVDRNPLRAGLVGEATAYPWSSAHEHASGTDETKMLSWARLSEAGGCADWEQRLKARAEPQEAERLRRATFSGTPFGGPDFRAELERRIGRTLSARPPPEDRRRKVPRLRQSGKISRIHGLREPGSFSGGKSGVVPFSSKIVASRPWIGYPVRARTVKKEILAKDSTRPFGGVQLHEGGWWPWRLGSISLLPQCRPRNTTSVSNY
jgi:putative transposase